MPPAEPPVYKLVGDGRPWSSLDASMKQFYINEQQRMEMEHGQSAPLASAPTHLASSGACLGSGQLGTPRARPSHWEPIYCLWGSRNESRR